MNKNNNLTQFNEGGLHSQNPNGGVMIGNNASVEQGETKNGNFIYSNRIVLDENVVSQYNLPKSLVGKSVADATKFIDNKFKGRNDKISQSTKDIMLSKIAEAQESMKPQEPEIEQQGLPENIENQNQMWDGGFKQYDTFNPNQGISYKFGQNNNLNAQSIEQQDAGMDGEGPSPQAVIGAAGTALDLGKIAFGKPMQDISGNQASADVNAGGMIAGNTLKGASAGTAIMPGLGTAIGAGVGAIAGLLGSRKTKKAALENSSNYATKTNTQFSDNYAFGGPIDPPKDNQPWQTKKIVKYQPGVTSGENGDSGFYLYSKNNTDPTFNYQTDREFVKNSAMNDLQKTAQWQDYMRNKNINPNSNINLNLNNPITDEYMYGGNMKKYANGGKLKPLDIPITSNLELNPINRIYTGQETDINFRNLLNDKNYLNSANINNFTQPNITPVNMEQPTLGQKLKYEIGNTLGNTGKVVNQNIGNLARYAPIAANALQLANLKKPQGERLDRLGNRYKPEYVDEAQLQNIANQTMNNTINAISQSGASEGQNRASILGSQLQRTKALSDAYGQAAAQNKATDDRAQTFNLGVDQVNLQQSNTEKDINARDSAAYRNAKREYITGIGEGIGSVGKEQTDKMIIAKSLGYKWDGEYVKSPEGKVVTDPDTGKPMTQDKLKELQTFKEKKVLGGYLIKNKTK